LFFMVIFQHPWVIWLIMGYEIQTLT